MDYLHSFSNNTDFNNMYNGSAYTEPWVSVTNTGSSTPSYRVNYNNKIKKLIGTPLTFEVTSNGSIVLKYNHRPSIPITVEYSKNGGTWETIQFVNTGEDVPQQSAITVTNGDIVQFRGDNERYEVGGGWSTYMNFGDSTCTFSLRGNIMSLVNSTGFVTATTCSYNAFQSIFKGCTGLTDASNLVLAATTGGGGCYGSMFENCTNLVKTPKILTTNFVSNYCCQQMFAGCTSLTKAPELPATTLPSTCYRLMFYGCTNLNYIECLATTLNTNCTITWVSGVSATGTFVKSPNVVVGEGGWSRGVNGIPDGWTVIDGE